MAYTISDDNKFVKVTDGGSVNDRFSKENLSVSARIIDGTTYIEFLNNNLNKLYRYTSITSPVHVSVDDLIEQVQGYVENILYMNATQRTLSQVFTQCSTTSTELATLNVTAIAIRDNVDINLSGAAKDTTVQSIKDDTQNYLPNIDNNTDATATHCSGINDKLDVSNGLLTSIETELQTMNSNSIDGSMIVTDYKVAVDLGLVPNKQYSCTHGLRKGVTGSNYLYIYQGGVDPYPFPVANVTVKVSSTSANDTALGTGARTIYIEGYLLDGTFQSETLTLNGQTGVTSVNSYYRVTKAFVITAGSTNANEGTVYIGTGTIVAGVNDAPLFGFPIGYANSFNSLLFVPAGKTGHIQEYSISVSIGGTNDKPALVQLMHRTPDGVVRVVDERGVRQDFNKGDYCYDFVGPCDLWFQGKPVSPADNIDIQTSMSVLIL